MEEELATVDEQLADYTPLERPSFSNLSNTHFRNDKILEDKSDSSSSEESDSSSSDNPSSKKKRKKPRLKHIPENNVDRKKNKYGVWSIGLQEEALTDELITSCEVQRNFDRTRDVESYDYSLAYKLAAENYHPPSEDQESNCDSSDLGTQNARLNESSRNSSFEFSLKRRHDSSGDGGKRSYRGRHQFGKRAGKSDSACKPGPPKILLPLSTTASDNDEDVAKDIAAKLNEEKEDLIMKVVRVLGKEKSIDLFVQTKKIEEDGGMSIVQGSRRRTPGGIFLFLLKQDRDVTNEDKQSIFADDRKAMLQEKKAAAARHRKLRSEELRRNIAAADGLPPLPTRQELAAKQGPMRDEDQEDVPEEGDVVSNPPPSPATDGRENGCVVADHERQLTSYDDYLDLGGGEDVMDVF